MAKKTLISEETRQRAIAQVAAAWQSGVLAVIIDEEQKRQ